MPDASTEARSDWTFGVRSPGVIVHRSSRVEALLEPLVTRLRDAPPPDPFTPVRIMVQSRGMQRWLTHQIAQRGDPTGAGIAANLQFPFPGVVIDDVVAACGSAVQEDPWTADRLVWPLLEALVEHTGRPGFERIDRYLRSSSATGVDRRTWRFARGVADVFDRYALYRPQLAAAWNAGNHLGADGLPLPDDDRWQPSLWAALVERLGDPTARLDRAAAVLADPAHELSLDHLPQDLVSFGISALPPRHLQLLAALARRTSVELYVPTASTARWEAIGAALDEGRPRPRPDHPLVVSCGRLADDAAELVLRLEPQVIAEPEPPAEPVTTLLGALQAGIRQDTVPSAGDRHHLEHADRSVQLHACHGPARQAEVLRDVVLGLLADDPTLEPRDVLVMTPDIDAFAPLVQAAFVGSGGVPDLPVRVADRQIGRTDPVADALLAVLDLAGNRASASQVLDVVGRSAVMQRFGLSPDDLSRITGWVADSGIRWGIDGSHRARAGQPADRVHTWMFGLDRLLLGVAMADEDHRRVGDVVPFDHVEGDDVALAGRFADACTTLFDAVEALSEPRPVDDWVTALTGVVDRCFATEPGARWQLHEIRARLEELRGTAAGAHAGDDRGSAEPLGELRPLLDLGAISAVVAQAVEQTRGTAGYETGAVTLCALVPMRSIPHRVICLLGMDDQAFPRSDARLGFDLLDRDDQLGDRDRRDEDRSLFLEAVLAARQHLVIATTGRDVRTNEPRPPAVPVAELLDVLERIATTGDPQATVGSAVTTDHPLQAFSPRNFGAPADGAPGVPISFDPMAGDAAEQGRHPTRHAVRFLEEPLSEVADEGPDQLPDGSLVELEHLASAVLHPTRFLLERRLGLYLRESVTETDDREPVDLDPLRRARLGRDLLGDPAALAQTDRWIDASLATGTVPAGTPGQVELAAVADDVGRLVDLARSWLVHHGADPCEVQAVQIDVPVPGRRIVGSVDSVHRSVPGSAVRLRADYVRPRREHLLRAWVDHLALSAAGVWPLTSVIVTRGKAGGDPPQQQILGPLGDDPDEARTQAIEALTDLATVHDAARCRLVALFPRSSAEYAATGRLVAARKVFEPNPYQLGDRGDRDEYVALAYGPEATLDDVLTDPSSHREFVRLASLVWSRMLEHSRRSVDGDGGPT